MQWLLNKQLQICGHSTNNIVNILFSTKTWIENCRDRWKTQSIYHLQVEGWTSALSLDVTVLFFVLAILLSPEYSSIYRVGGDQTSTDASYLSDLRRKYTFSQLGQNALNHFFLLLGSRKFNLFSVRVEVNRNVATALSNIIINIKKPSI